MKRCYPHNDRGQANITLGSALHTRSFLQDFGLANPPDSSAESLADIHAGIQGSVSAATAFTTAAKLRNTTGHNLVWDNIFSTPSQYVELFRQVMNAILFVVSRKMV